MESVLQSVAVVAGAIAVTVVVGWLADKSVRRVATQRPWAELWPLLRRCRIPMQLSLATMLVLAVGSAAWEDGTAWWRAVRHSLVLVSVVAASWLLVRVIAVVVEASFARYAEAAADDPARVRRVRTQTALVRRVLSAVVVVVAGSVMLLTFQQARAVGASVLASAGIFGIVAGIAAQSTLGNLVAGLQIAFGDMVRIGDVTVVDGEWGTIEEITLSHLVLLTWDQRRIVMPVSYFTSKPFENWTRTDPKMTGAVILYLDHATPVDELRKELHNVVRQSKAWDGRDWSLDVTDTTPSTIVVRAVVTAKDSGDLWQLRCLVRERLIGYLRDHHPSALPKISTAPAPGYSFRDGAFDGSTPETALGGSTPKTANPG